MGSRKEYGLASNWKCILACLLVSMSPFQYGIDFGLIGGMQAMIGFLQASLCYCASMAIPFANDMNRSLGIGNLLAQLGGTSLPEFSN